MTLRRRPTPPPVTRPRFSRQMFPFLLVAVLLASGAVFDWLLPLTPTVHAATFTVTNDHDDGAGSLRAAIANANATAGTDTILFDITGAGPHTIQLASALPALSDSVDITNTSGESVTVRRDTGGNYRVFTINSGQTVNINGLTISNGFTTNGGGIYNSGTLNVTNSAVSNSFSVSGGGIYNNGGTVTLTNSAVSNNNGSSGGGGIFNNGTLNVTDSTVSGNSANGSSGGIYNLSGTVTLTNSAFSNNSGGSGGGIYNNDGTVTLTNCTVSGNSATFGGGGGGISNIGTLNLTNSTVSGNSAAAGGGIFNIGTLNLTNSTVSGNSAVQDGGGIYTDGGNATLTGVTITNNRADSDNNGGGTGGGIYIQSGTPLLRSTIVAGNFKGPGSTADDINVNGGSSANGTSSYNLIGTGGAGGLTHGTNNNQVGVADPRLGPLANNGGPTQTHHLLAGSPAIDKGDDFSASAMTDQRGLLRPFDDPAILNSGDGTDIGAYEVQDRGGVQVAPSLVVNTPGDHDDGCTTGDCTLREAITAANNHSGKDTITFDLPGPGPHTIQLDSQLPSPDGDVDILNNSGESVTVRGEGADDPYHIFAIAGVQTVNISGLTITNGSGALPGGTTNTGGGIYINGATLNLTDCIVSGNTAQIGGGIYSTGTLTLTNSTVSGNSASSNGGGIKNDGGTLNLTNSTVSGNLANEVGGGIFNHSGTLTLTNSTVSGNSGVVFAGGILNKGNGTLNLTNCTVSGNSTNVDGGGIYIEDGSATLTGVTITDNRADNDNNGEGEGGGIYTFWDYNPPLLRSTIVAGNFKGTGSAADDIAYAPVAGTSSYNLIGTGGSGGLTDGVNHNQVGVANPGLLPLANNGGPTQTHAVLSTSPAIDKGNAFGSTTDQRGTGFPRVVGAAADVGAVEGPDIDPPTVTINQALTQADPTNVSPVNFTVVFSEAVSNFATGDVTLSGTAGATTANVTGSDTTYNVAVSGMTANGTIVATIAAGKATDASGNPNAASTSTDNTVTFTAFPANITATAGTPQSATINTAFATALQATVTDGSGTPVSGVNVTFTAPPSGASGTFANGTATTTATTNASGVATATTFTANGTVGGPYVVMASAGALATSFSPTNTSPANVSGTKTKSGGNTPGSTITYTVVLSNSGAAAQANNSGNEFTDTLPASLSLVSATASSGTAATAANTVTWNGSIAGGGSVTITITATINSVADGTVVSNQGTINYDSDANNTNDAIRSTDDPSVGGASDPTVFPVVDINDPPDAVDDALSSVSEDSGVRTIPIAMLLANDTKGPTNESGQTLTLTGVSNPVGGTVSRDATNVYFTPAADFNGPASFQYTITDNGTTGGTADPKTDTATVSFTITTGNDAPTANNDTLPNIAEDSGPRLIVAGTLFANDSKGGPDENGQTLTIKTVSNPEGGSVAIVNGDVVFTPTANYSGSAIFSYTVEDNGTTNGSPDPKTSLPAVVQFNITPVADTPSVTNATTDANTQTTSGLVISRNPVDGPEVSHFKITAISGGTLFKSNGTTVINNGDFITFAEGNAGLKFTPGVTNGSFQVQASTSSTDAGLGGGMATATITVNASGGVLKFSSATYSVAEGAGFRTITVERSGDTSQAVTVDYTSSDHSTPADSVPCNSGGPGVASSRCDFTTALGTLRFAAGETSKTFNVLITNDNYVEGPETLDLTLSNPTNGVVFGVPQTSILTIIDDVAEPATNPIDSSADFVRAQYHDILSREPDAAGLAFWTDNIEKCTDPARIPAGLTVEQCVDKQRESTAVAFFMSPEFQMTGGYVYHLYKGSLTGAPNYDGGSAGSSPGRFPTFLEFMRDMSAVSEGIVVDGAISGAVVEANRNALAAAFVLRPEFVAKYGGLNNTLYVNELFNTTGIAATAAEKQTLVDGLTNATETRASVLRKVVDGTVVITEGNVQFTTTYGQAFINQENNRLFVYLEYIGYLRRNPDQAGFVFWL
ncbi:MAG TPA: choice-of-anchor Q domain-containing protein, partial [Pyrinomonadaceae bacterium]|nr:choice-of-anchor Q domain-containing protein [Pyrinomonadaceae bacterium]